jgi:hypothetical protein
VSVADFADGLSWPPVPGQYYLPAGPARPVMQGDVFDLVPFAKAKRGSKFADPPNISSERRLVAVLGYPCDIYLDGRLARVQTVAPVTDATASGIPGDWAGAFTLAPLPDLLGDGRMYAVDLRVAANIDAFYLDRTNRKRCLSELGWASFRQRIGLAGTRLLNPLSDLASVGSEIWVEMSMWQTWNESGRAEADFQTWLDAPEANLGGFTHRATLDRGMYDVALASLNAALGS